MRFCVVVVVLFGVACGEASVPDQVGEACTDIGGAFCDRAVDCGFIGGDERLSWVNAFFAGCCGDDGVCNAEVDPAITGSVIRRSGPLARSVRSPGYSGVVAMLVCMSTRHAQSQAVQLHETRRPGVEQWNRSARSL